MRRIKTIGRQLIIGLISTGCLAAGVVSASGIFYYNSGTLYFKDSLTVNNAQQEQLDSATGDNSWVSDSYLKYVVGETAPNNFLQINNGDNQAVFRFIADSTQATLQLRKGGEGVSIQVPTATDSFISIRPFGGTGSGKNNGLVVRRGATGTGSTDFAVLGVRSVAGSGNAAFIGYNTDDKGLALFADGSSNLSEARFIGSSSASNLFVNQTIKLNTDLNLVPSTNPAGTAVAGYNRWLVLKDNSNVISGNLTVQQLYIGDNASAPGFTPPFAQAPVSRQWVLNQNYIKPAGWVATGDVPWANVDNIPAEIGTNTSTVLTLPGRAHSHDIAVLWYAISGRTYTGYSNTECSGSARGRYNYKPSAASGTSTYPISYTNLGDGGTYNQETYTYCNITYFCPGTSEGLPRQSYVVLHANSRTSNYDWLHSSYTDSVGDISKNFTVSGTLIQSWDMIYACAYQLDSFKTVP